jgi:hypothetical protein
MFAMFDKDSILDEVCKKKGKKGNSNKLHGGGNLTDSLCSGLAFPPSCQIPE